mgnify:CR=1 FL=1
MEIAFPNLGWILPPVSETAILLLEDSLELGALTMDVLNKAGYGSVRHVVNNEDAIAALEDEGFDLCIFDLRLQGVTCEAAMDAALDQDIPVILTSGNSFEVPVRSKGYVFVEKPTARERLAKAIEEALDGTGFRNR